MFIGENELEVLKVYYNITSISLFRIDILLSSEIIQSGAKISRAELNDKIELQEVLRLLYLSVDQYLDSRKLLKVFIIHNND